RARDHLRGVQAGRKRALTAARHGVGACHHPPTGAAPPGFDPRRQRAWAWLDVQGAPPHREHRCAAVAPTQSPTGAAMSAGAGQLFRQVLLIEVGTHVASFLLTAIFAPRVLLLEGESSTASYAVIAVMGVLCAGLAAGLTAIVLHTVRPLLTA